MARVEWRRARFDTVAHAVIEGDVLVLCGAMTRKGPRPAEDFGHIVAPEAVPGMACPYCREIITEAAEALRAGRTEAEIVDQYRRDVALERMRVAADRVNRRSTYSGDRTNLVKDTLSPESEADHV